MRRVPTPLSPQSSPLPVRYVRQTALEGVPLDAGGMNGLVDDLTALDRAGDELRPRLAQLRPEHLRQPSVLPGWSVFDLVNHVIGLGCEADEQRRPLRTRNKFGEDVPRGRELELRRSVAFL